MAIFEKRPFWIFFSKKKIFFLLHSHENQSKFIWQNEWVEILTLSLVSRKFLAMRNTVYVKIDLLIIFLLLQFWAKIAKKEYFTHIFQKQKLAPKTRSTSQACRKQGGGTNAPPPTHQPHFSTALAQQLCSSTTMYSSRRVYSVFSQLTFVKFTVKHGIISLKKQD